MIDQLIGSIIWWLVISHLKISAGNHVSMELLAAILRLLGDAALLASCVCVRC